jgi:hypothetical protein
VAVVSQDAAAGQSGSGHISGEVAQDVVGLSGGLNVYDPVFLPGRWGNLGEQMRPALLEGEVEAVAKDPSQQLDGEEELGVGRSMPA